MTNIFWTNSTKSGLCDRLLDLSLMASLAKLYNYNLILKWEPFYSSSGGYTPSNKNAEESGFTKYDSRRYEDYLYENFTQYFTVPQNVNVFQDSQMKDLEIDFLFEDYLGGVHSVKTFWEKYLSQKVSFQNFLLIYEDILSEFKPTQKLLDVVNSINSPKLSVHLRRTDKVVIDPDHFAVSEVEELNKKTLDSINSFIQKNGEDVKIYFSSDDNREKNEYKNRYKNYLVEEKLPDLGFINTYIDMFLLSTSETIILSQKHSNFSIFCSLIGKTRLIYLYDDCPIVELQYPSFKNFINYKYI